MYEKHFGFSKLPFSVAADPGNFYLSSTHQEALTNLHYGVQCRKGLIAVIGEPGTGKTSLLRMFVASTPPNIRTAIIYDPRISWKTMLRRILSKCGINAPRSDSEGMMRRLETHLKRELKQQRSVVLLIDEAQTLSDDLLEQLRLLSNLEADQEKLLQIVLVGQSELEEKLSAAKFSALQQRIALRLQLSPLQPEAVEGYIKFMLQKAGYQGKELFDKSAVDGITYYSRGIPRLISSLCDNALLATYRAFEQSVSVERIDKAARDLRIQIQQGNPALADPLPADLPAVDLPSDATGQFYFGDEQSGNDDSWQEEFDASLADVDEAPTRNQGPSRSQGARLFMFLALVLITAAALIYFRPGGDHAQVDRFAVGQANLGEPSFPEPVEEHREPAPLMASAFDPLPSFAPTTRETVRGTARVFVHTPEDADRPVITQIAKALKAAGYELPDPRIADGRTGGDVRFFFSGDRKEANTVKSLVETELRKRGFAISLQLLERDGRKFQHAAPGKIEVWLPPLPSRSNLTDS
jgi:general secretion pathway protein A